MPQPPGTCSQPCPGAPGPAAGYDGAPLEWTLRVLPGRPFRARGWGGTPTPALGLLAEGTGLSAGGASQQVVSLGEALPWPGA